MVHIRELSSMPWIHLFASTACNLNCPYCSQGTLKIGRIENDFLQDQGLLEFISQIPPTHIYLSGGEPLIHPGIKEFVAFAGRCGHKVSLDTNLSIPMKKLEDLLTYWDPDSLGFVNISHHIICGISLEYILSRVQLIQDAHIGHFVKYVGVPEMLLQIGQNMKYLREKGIGAAVTIIQGDWNGRRMPECYAPEEAIKLLELCTLNTHGLQVFGGIKSYGLTCRGGQDFIAYNMHGDKSVIPCCHGSLFPVSMDRTFYGTGNRERIKCPIDTCLGDLMFICGINGIIDEMDLLDAICRGSFEFLGVDSVLEFTNEIIERGYELVDYRMFLEMERQRLLRIHKRSVDENRVLQNHPAVPKRADFPILKNKTAPEMVAELEDFITRWKTPRSVISDNPSMESSLKSLWTKIPYVENDILTRALAKKVAQQRFALPRKCNFEVMSTCVLRCEFCVLSDLKKYRRKVRMTYDDFMKIWKFMEVFTTEVEFTGGEPLLNKDVFAMIAEVNKTGVYSTLTTNAQFLDERRCERVLEAQPSKILIAYDSVEAKNYESTRIHGKFDRLKENIVHLVDRKHALGLTRPEINIQMVVSKKNVDEIDLFWQEAVKMGVDSASIKPILVWPGSSPEFEKKMVKEYLIPGHPLSYHHVDENGELVKPRKPGFCPNIHHVHIGSGSEVIPCWYILKDTYVAGYAADNPFLEIWYSDEYVEYRHRMKEETVLEACQGCIGRHDPRLFVTKTANELSKSLSSGSHKHLYPQTLVKETKEISIVPVRSLHNRLGFATPIDYPATSLEKPLSKWKMETDDAPIFRYIYRHFRPRRHLEFGTWQGQGVLYCLEECDATVWTINVPFGENGTDSGTVYSNYPEEVPFVRAWAEKVGLSKKDYYRTDSLGFIGRHYLENEMGYRVCQIYCDSRHWDISNFPPGFFDTVLIDGGHTKDIVISDTQKAFQLLRPGGIIMWHDFCPQVIDQFESTRGVMEAISQEWDWINSQTSQLFWIYPSWILLGVKNGSSPHPSIQNAQMPLGDVQNQRMSPNLCEGDLSEEQVIQERLGRMLNRFTPISDEELQAAVEALMGLLSATDIPAHIEARRRTFPEAMLPLLIINLATAWSDGNMLLAEVLERVYGLLTMEMVPYPLERRQTP